MILRPPTPISPLIATVAISGETIRAHLPAKHEPFRTVLKRLSYQWQGPRGPWWRTIDTRWHGSVEDRAAELVAELVRAGFVVEVGNDALAQRALSGAYAPEQRRWVKLLTGGSCQGWFALSWPHEDDFYVRARRIPGSQYEASHVIAPPDAWREVLDFADAHGFAVSKLAREAAAAAETRYATAVLAVPAAPAPRPVTERNAGGIDPDLADADD